MANKRILSCGKKEVLAIGQEGSFSDLHGKIAPCKECFESLDCVFYSNYLKDIIKTQESFIYLRDKIRVEQNLI